MNELTAAQIKDLQILASFISLFCHAHHDRAKSGASEIPQFLCDAGQQSRTICRDCGELLEYGINKRAVCPLQPKPACRSCHIHCYTPEYREKIRKIMAWSGRKMILRGRLDYLWHYFIKS